MRKAFIVLLNLLFGLTLLGCHNTTIIYESGFYQYKILYTNPKQKHIMIVGLTEMGKEQVSLILPEDIDGIPVLKLGKQAQMMFDVNEGQLVSDQLEKIYLGPNLLRCRAGIFSGCPNLKTVLINNGWIESEIQLYSYDPDIPVQVRIYLPKTGAWKEVTEVLITDMMTFANVTYYWNYEDSPNEGVYFIDDQDGTIIDFRPLDPQREGFVFLGWYTEPECLTEWNFEQDIVVGRTYDEDGVSPYHETALYAKWE